MVTITIPAFAGAMPKVSPRLLETQNAKECVNCDLGSGALRSLRAPAHEQALKFTAATLFRHDADGWMAWEKAVNVVKSAVLDADGEKPLGQLLITGDREYPTMYLAGGEVYRLGIPRPAEALKVNAVADAMLLATEGRAWSATDVSAAPVRYGQEGLDLCGILQDGDTAEIAILSRAALKEEDGGDDEESKENITDSGIQRSTSYLYTYVQQLAGGAIQYESAPSPASEIIDVLDNEGVTLTGFALPDLEGIKITHIRIYRTVSGTESSDFHLLVELSVEELEAAGWSYTDIEHDMNVSSEVLQTSTWDAIPDNAKGLIKADNGLYACFRGNELLVSEPFIPYAFPASYRNTVESSIVALAHVDGTIVVLTTGRPYLAQGTAPESLALVHLPIEQSCVSAQSVATLPGGVIYASPDGLMLFTSNEQSLITGETFSREQWQELGPERLMGSVHDGRYVAFFKETNEGLLFHIGRADMVRLELPEGWQVHALYHHSEDDALYLSVETTVGCGIWKFEGGDSLLPYRWRSKEFFTSALCGMAAARVEGEQSGRNPVSMHIFGPDARRARAKLRLTDGKTVRIRPTRSERLWSFELSGTTAVYEARLGGSVEGVENGV
ncbi:MAG: hypothetical protein LUG19_12680 [Desulfovibrio sp.]|uniref:hypothetical protein n=1 Tax=Desulfovibrio sp. TaxID=885 RepID=UPI0025825F2B|nr:hypothetical protein [Desulfovibrio sp.]MCD7985086.1 hypothetical protein [Desulfovibrio sp.]